MLSCVDVEELAPELALGLVTGPERASALSHLAGCSTCRARVDELSVAADALALASPETEPPPGFEARVLDAIDREPVARIGHRRRLGRAGGPARGGGRARRVGAIAAAVLVVVALSLAALGDRLGWTLGGGPARPSAVAVPMRQAAMRTPSGHTVGTVAMSHRPDAMILTLPGWAPPDGQVDDVHIRIELAGGSTRDLGVLPAAALHGGWTGTVPIDTRRITRVSMVDRGGSSYCSAAL